MARVDEIEGGFRVELGARRLERVRIQRLGQDEIEAGERRRHRVEVAARFFDAPRKLVKDPLHLEPLGELGLAERVVRFQDLERLDEDRLPARRLVVDDPLDRGAVLGLDRHDVAPTALRDDRVLQHPEQVRRPHESIEALLEPSLRRAQVGPQRAEPGARPIEDLAGRADRVLDRGRDIGGWSRETRAGRERGIRMDIGEQALGGPDRLRNGDELDWIERAAEPRAAQRVADVSRAAQAARWARAQKVPRRRGLILEALRLADVGRRKERFGELPTGRECGPLSQ